MFQTQYFRISKLVMTTDDKVRDGIWNQEINKNNWRYSQKANTKYRSNISQWLKFLAAKARNEWNKIKGIEQNSVEVF